MDWCPTAICGRKRFYIVNRAKSELLKSNIENVCVWTSDVGFHANQDKILWRRQRKRRPNKKTQEIDRKPNRFSVCLFVFFYSRGRYTIIRIIYVTYRASVFNYTYVDQTQKKSKIITKKDYIKNNNKRKKEKTEQNIC